MRQIDDKGMHLPTFFLIGAAKAGTTSIHHYLDQHPGVEMSRQKEPLFFHFDGGAPSLKSLVDIYGRDRLEDTKVRHKRLAKKAVTSLPAYHGLWTGASAKVRGESSISYLNDMRVPAKIAARIPDARIIAVLRQPMDRAVSGYRMDRRAGREPCGSFEEAIRLEPVEHLDFWWGGRWFLRPGFYARLLTPWYEAFGRERIHIELYEDLVENPERLMERLFEFIGADSSFRPDLSMRLNAASRPRPILQRVRGQLGRTTRFFRTLLPSRDRARLAGAALPGGRDILPDPEARRALTRRYYAEDINHLSALIERDLSHWLE